MHRAPLGRPCALERRRSLSGALVAGVLAVALAGASPRAAAKPDAVTPAGPDDGVPPANDRPGGLAGALAVAAALEAGAIVVLVLAIRRRRREDAGASRDVVEIARLTRVGATREVGRMVAGEIRTPLTSALNNLGAARRLLLRDPPPLDEIGAAMDEAQAAGESVAQVLHRLRSLAPPTCAADVVELNDVVREGVRLVASAGAASIAVELSPVPGILGDRVELLQAVLELLLNAMEEATAAERGSVTVRTRSEGDVVELSVEHPGASLFEQDRARILSPLLPTEPPGLGTSLAVARSIVESYGGRISAEPPPHAPHLVPDRPVSMRVRFQRALPVSSSAPSR